MQMKELQSMTVVQLRALARENKVKLSAGIDKEGIVQRLYHALGDSDESTAATQEEAAPVSAEGTVSAESSAVPQENRLEESLAADVTSVQPGSGYRPWGSERTEETNGNYHPVFRQGWQARTAPQRETSPRPAWQQQQRPVGTANRFGPQASAPSQPVVQQEERQDSYQPRIPENAPRLDGYRLGYRAAPQRPSYQNRDNGYRNSSYGGGNASYNNGYNNSYNNGYRQNNFRQQSRARLRRLWPAAADVPVSDPC